MLPIVETYTIVLVVLIAVLVLFSPVPGIILYTQHHWTTTDTISSKIKWLHQLPLLIHWLATLQEKHGFLMEPSQWVLDRFDEGWNR